MDLNEYSKIQCLNCHADILRTSSQSNHNPTATTICQICLNRYSNEIASMQTHNQLLEKQLIAFKNLFQQELSTYQNSKSMLKNEKSIEDMEAELKLLQKQSAQLETEEKQKTRTVFTLIDQFDSILTKIDQQSHILSERTVTLTKMAEKQSELTYQLAQLQQKKEQLQKLPILLELYNVHFDDKSAYINSQPVTYKTAKLILEILCLLVDKYHYQGFKINFSENQIKIINQQKTFSILTQSEESTVPWLSFIAEQIPIIWEHMKKQADILTQESHQSYALPFPVSLKSDPSICTFSLSPGPSYPKFLKYLTHDLKFMLNFDSTLNIKMRSCNDK